MAAWWSAADCIEADDVAASAVEAVQYSSAESPNMDCMTEAAAEAPYALHIETDCIAGVPGVEADRTSEVAQCIGDQMKMDYTAEKAATPQCSSGHCMAAEQSSEPGGCQAPS